MRDLVAIALGALAVGVVAGYTLDWHRHRCDRCDHTWSHLGALNAGNEDAHTCARCGARQWWVDGTPAVIRAAHERVHGPTNVIGRAA